MIRGLLILALILLVVLAGLPLVMAMGPMLPCPECHLTGGLFAMCLAILGLLALAVPATAGRFYTRRSALRLLLLGAPPERPPRSL